ncbi:hypothetical protein CELD12_24640 [Cellulomonas sp. NTE-D12]|nr:hypothetical protein CELD12_24640 [Cellulomonas sp. NTE-D12]
MSAGTIGVEFSEPASGRSSWWMRKNPCDSAIRSTSPTTRSAPFPSTAHPTSWPTTAASTSTFASYRRAVRTAAGRSSGPETLLTPNDEPERAGLTNTGYGRASASTSSSGPTVRKSGVATPAPRATTYASDLSMHAAELATPQPT